MMDLIRSGVAAEEPPNFKTFMYKNELKTVYSPTVFVWLKKIKSIKGGGLNYSGRHPVIVVVVVIAEIDTRRVDAIDML